MSRIMDYVSKMLQSHGAASPYRGILGAYNMGLWGVSESGQSAPIEGTLCTGTAVTQMPVFRGGDGPAAENYVKFYDTPNLWGFGDGQRVAPSETVRSAYEHAAAVLGISSEELLRGQGLDRIEQYLKAHMGGIKWGLDEWQNIATVEAVQREMDEAGAWTGLVNRWYAVIAQSRYLIDVTSLGAPVLGSEAQVGICMGVRECLTRWARDDKRKGEDAPLMIRILFGNTGAATSGKKDWDEFLERLRSTLADINSSERISRSGAASLPVVLLGSDFGRVSKWANFNHSKIVAGDGHYAIVGGHNMCEEVSSNRAPVIHDVTAEVTGPGARSANAFAGSVWMKAAESGRLWIYRFNWETSRFDDVSSESARLWAPKNWVSYSIGTQDEVPKVIRNQHWFYPMNKLPRKAAAKAPSGSVPATAIMGIGRWGDYQFFGVDGSGGLKLGAGIPASHACHYASDILKRLMIADRDNTLIRMSQQDLVNAGNFGAMMQPSDHTICEAIGNRLTATKKGTSIQIVVSTRYAQNSQGLSYSYGDGPREAAERISDVVRGARQASSSKTDLPERLAVLDISKAVGDGEVRAIAGINDPSYVTVAPLVFCAARGATRDRGSYVWPDGRYVYEKLYGNNRFWNKDDTSEAKMGPGNHSKVMIVSIGDDDASGLVMIGSDNMYPSPLSEFNFVIEGAEAVEAFRTQYWDKLWGYSARMGFTVDPQGKVT